MVYSVMRRRNPGRITGRIGIMGGSNLNTTTRCRARELLVAFHFTQCGSFHSRCESERNIDSGFRLKQEETLRTVGLDKRYPSRKGEMIVNVTQDAEKKRACVVKYLLCV